MHPDEMKEIEEQMKVERMKKFEEILARINEKHAPLFKSLADG